MRTTIELNQKEVEAMLLQTFGNTGLNVTPLRVEDLHCYFYSKGDGSLSATITDEPLPQPKAVDVPLADDGINTPAAAVPHGAGAGHFDDDIAF